MHIRTLSDDLAETIYLAKEKQQQELVLLKEQFYKTYETIKPINIIKNSLSEIVMLPDIKKNIAGSLLGLLTGYISKRILVGSSHNIIKKTLGTLLEFAVANLVAKHSNTIKLAAEKVVDTITKINNNKPENDNEEF